MRLRPPVSLGITDIVDVDLNNNNDDSDKSIDIDFRPKMKGGSSAVALALAAAAPCRAYLRVGCATLSVRRLDPLVEPGAVPSAHLHQIVGGNGFNATMDPAEDVGERATCTTCTTCSFSEDFSNYWTAVLYSRARATAPTSPQPSTPTPSLATSGAA